MKRIKIFAVAAILCATAYSGYLAYQEATMSDQERMFQANLEALTDNESNGVLECDGFFGWCSFTCEHCGASLKALGDKLINTHKCNQQ